MARLEHPTLLEPREYYPLQSALHASVLSREAARCTPRTLEHCTYTLGAFLEFLRSSGVVSVQEMVPDHIRRYLVSLQRQGPKDTAQRPHGRGIKAWLNWLVVEGELDVSLMRRVAMPRLEKRMPPHFHPDDVRKLLAACDRKTGLGFRNRAIVLGLLDSGLPLAEFASLRAGDANMRGGLAAVMGKVQKQRSVRAGSKARSAIMHMLASRDNVQDGEPLWLAYDIQGQETRALSLHRLQTTLVRLGRRAGVTPCAPHRFRRTFALWMPSDGCDLHSLRMLVEHSSLAVLQRYIQPRDASPVLQGRQLSAILWLQAASQRHSTLQAMHSSVILLLFC